MIDFWEKQTNKQHQKSPFNGGIVQLDPKRCVESGGHHNLFFILALLKDLVSLYQNESSRFHSKKLWYLFQVPSRQTIYVS